eukprot:TRINITY_DN48269_c0_g1_i1.p2 TRINITY_DN48269_c0_g1~~TRINITY_DN48269_c0_g1_i1.p2  ORF type:complete len:200 (+),score=34.67 TRINITY_DN48269_c0_g1_i1:308-907(+)
MPPSTRLWNRALPISTARSRGLVYLFSPKRKDDALLANGTKLSVKHSEMGKDLIRVATNFAKQKDDAVLVTSEGPFRVAADFSAGENERSKAIEWRDSVDMSKVPHEILEERRQELEAVVDRERYDGEMSCEDGWRRRQTMIFCSRVQLHELKSRLDLSGTLSTFVNCDVATGRWAVRFDAARNTKTFKAANLLPFLRL